MSNTISDTIPTDWNEFEIEWDLWTILHWSDLRPCDARFVDKNFMADEILGTWTINGRMTELSTGTFPSLDPAHRGEIHRSIGITVATSDGIGREIGGVVHSWTELNEKLGL